jgi:ketosteroid isomerase-like protein
MKKAFGILAAIFFAYSACPEAAVADDASDVKAVIQSAYVEGVHVKLDAAKMRKGFHPDFRMLVLKDGKMSAVTLEEWISRMELREKENPNAPRPAIKADFPMVNVTGNAAVARVEITRDGKHTFTDYLSLYKFPDGWMIVSKIFQAHS